MSWCWPSSSTVPTGAGTGGKGWSSPASTTSSSTPGRATPLPHVCPVLGGGDQVGRHRAPKPGLCTPRITQNLPLRSHRLSPTECFRTFVKAIFYVGKGTRARPCCHLAEALSQHRAGTQRVGWAVLVGTGRGGSGPVVTVSPCPSGLSQGAAHPGDLGERAGRRLGVLLPEPAAGGGVHAGELPRGGAG